MARVLILAGTTEATQLAHRFTAAGADVISSLAGVTSSPVERPGRVRTGGFGGPDGLARYLEDHRIDAVVDATHPFASVMPFHAVEATRRTATPYCRLLRSPWEPVDGDRWVSVRTIPEAAAVLPTLGATRVLLTVGRQSVAPFAGCDGVAFVARAIEPVVLPGAEVVLGRGPFGFEDELELLEMQSIDTVVAKNSGGSATSAKLAAARELGITVVMVERPPQPVAPQVGTVDDAVRWYLELPSTASGR